MHCGLMCWYFVNSLQSSHKCCRVRNALHRHRTWDRGREREEREKTVSTLVNTIRNSSPQGQRNIYSPVSLPGRPCLLPFLSPSCLSVMQCWSSLLTVMIMTNTQRIFFFREVAFKIWKTRCVNFCSGIRCDTEKMKANKWHAQYEALLKLWSWWCRSLAETGGVDEENSWARYPVPKYQWWKTYWDPSVK